MLKKIVTFLGLVLAVNLAPAVSAQTSQSGKPIINLSADQVAQGGAVTAIVDVRGAGAGDYLIYIYKSLDGRGGSAYYKISCDANNNCTQTGQSEVNDQLIALNVTSIQTEFLNQSPNGVFNYKIDANLNRLTYKVLEEGKTYNVDVSFVQNGKTDYVANHFLVQSNISNTLSVVFSPDSKPAVDTYTESNNKNITLVVKNPTDTTYKIINSSFGISGSKTVKCTQGSNCQFDIISQQGLNPGPYEAVVQDVNDNSKVGKAILNVTGDKPNGVGGAQLAGIDSLPTSDLCPKTDPNCTRSGAQGHCKTEDQVETALGCIPTEPGALINGLLRYITGAAGGIALLLMSFGAFQMITSAGNPDNVKKGREQFDSAIIGLLFVIFSVLLMQIIGVDILGLKGVIGK